MSLEGGNKYACPYRTYLTHPTVQEALVEALTHVDADELQVAIQALADDKQSRFLPVLDNGVCSLLRVDNDSYPYSAIEGLQRCVTVLLCLVLSDLVFCSLGWSLPPQKRARR
jgi:hypothetical protein